MAEDYCEDGQIVEIDGLGRHRKVAGKRYSYEKDKSHCPACGGVGFPWHGWFSCNDCAAVALIETGEVFMPAPAG